MIFFSVIAERQLQGEIVSILVILLEPVNVALGVMGEFVRLSVTEFSSSGVVICAVELLANSICGIGETSLSFMEKMNYTLIVFFLLTATFCLTNSSVLYRFY